MKKKMLLMSSIGVMAPVSVYASEATGTSNAAVTNAMQTVAADMMATGNSVIPIALTVVGLALVVTFGVRMFRRVAK